MVDLFPLPAEMTRDGLYSVIGGALAGGAPEPSWIAVDNGSDAWVVEVSGFSAVERARGVVAASSEEAVMKAQRLGIGGAMWLPPASLGAIEAFAAAASTEAPRAHDAASLELLDGATSVHVVTFSNRPFWRAQLGDRELGTMLAELAVSLEAPVAILQWPALVLADRDQAAIVKAWDELVAEKECAPPAVSVLSPTGTESGILSDAYSALTTGMTAGESSSSMPAQPVHELPHGGRVGWWGLGTSDMPEDEGWFARPEDVTSTPFRWLLDGTGTSGPVQEVLTGDEVAGLDQVLAVRVPGWASQGLRAGSPAGLLLTRIAAATSRRGLPLWVPNVDQEGLRFVLGLPGTIWVDGPAVPNPGSS
ncbi:MAG: hypothetical protein OQK55_01315 [Thermoanaerobaculales bacterium]|nr:hypothetical protein [Thermoanaerobaculales bacterium]